MALHAASFLRSPFLGVVSYLRPSPLASYRNAVLIDPLLAGGKRSGFLLALLGVGYGLAWEIHRRLRKRGAPASRAFFWAALVFLGGVSVYIVSFLVETPGAYRKVRLLRDEEAPRCLLRSSLTLPPQPENVS
jgi:hypothetical protein